jgi:NAD(P)H-hydrate epimerase
VIPVLSRAQIRAFDALAIEACKVPSLVLMENAARGATDVLVRELLGGSARGKSVVVLCGTGNNGGDGFAMARRLLTLGATPELFLLGSADKLSKDALANADAWRGLGGSITPLEMGDALSEALATADACVDALFGTGLDRPLAGTAGHVVEALRPHASRVFAVDVPSGLDADTGAVLGVAVRAAVTATFAHCKLGLLTPSGAEHAGRVFVADIGVPASLVAVTGQSAGLIELSDVAALFPWRSPSAHKYTAGHLAVLAGSPGKIGAARLVARGAHRAGAGAVTLGLRPEAAAALEAGTLETMTARLDFADAKGALAAFLDRKAAAVVGPGFGVDAEARAMVEELLTHQVSAVLDADALTVFAGRAAELAKAKCPLVLTPHAGEAARLLGVPSDSVERDRFGSAASLAKTTGAAVLLKGAHTVVAAPDGRLAILDVGNPSLATAGSGDVLAGIVGALLAHLPPFEAAYAGAYLHGAAADRWSEGVRDRGLLASEIADQLPDVLAALRK